MERRRPSKDQLKRVDEIVDRMAHAHRCRKTRCPYLFCEYEKDRLLHVRNCRIGMPRNCSTCWEVGNLLVTHAKYCKRSICRVPNCASFRRRMFIIASAA